MRRFVPLVLILSIIALIPLSLPKGLGVESNLRYRGLLQRHW
jgi:hypothetical protein